MKNEIALHSAESAFKIAEELLSNGDYVVMISREEQLWIVNYKHSENCNRNDVVFMSRDEWEDSMNIWENNDDYNEEGRDD